MMGEGEGGDEGGDDFEDDGCDSDDDGDGQSLAGQRRSWRRSCARVREQLAAGGHALAAAGTRRHALAMAAWVRVPVKAAGSSPPRSRSSFL